MISSLDAICRADTRAQREVIRIPRADLETARAIQTIAGIDESDPVHLRQVDHLGLGTHDHAIATAVAAFRVEADPQR